MDFPDQRIEELRNNVLLVIILAVAACTRFYSLDEAGLSAGELSNIAVCDARGWFAMVDQYTGNSGMPPAYPMLLCQFAAWVSNAEFFVRALSGLFGVASVYVIYLFGKHFFSTVSGLLAAAVVATDFQAILLDRTATLYPLLALGMLAHSYCFCRLLLSDAAASDCNIAVNVGGNRWGVQWHWQPAFACDARFLLGFWISGVLVFYISTMALVLLSVELGACFILLIAGSHRRTVLRSMWLPLLIAMLPWLPTFAGFYKWILKGNLLGMPSLADMLDKLRCLFPIDPIITQAMAILAVILIATLGIQKARRTQQQEKSRFWGLVIVQLVIAVTAFWLIIASDPKSYLYFRELSIILLVYPIAVLMVVIPHPAWRNVCVAFAVIAIMIFQIESNSRFKLYMRGGEEGFKLAVKIIHDDQEFMNGGRQVFFSTPLFQYYLDKSVVTSKNNVQINEETFGHVEKMVKDANFYYLEHRDIDEDFNNDIPVFVALSKQYKILCLTRLPKVRITKFSTDAALDENQAVDCRSYSSGLNILQ